MHLKKEVYTSATMHPKHTFGEGDVIVAGFDESVDFGASTSRSIKPTKSSFWQIQNVILPTGTKHLLFQMFILHVQMQH